MERHRSTLSDGYRRSNLIQALVTLVYLICMVITFVFISLSIVKTDELRDPERLQRAKIEKEKPFATKLEQVQTSSGDPRDVAK